MRARRVVAALVLLAVVVFLNLPLPASMRVKAVSLDGLAPFENIMSLVVRNVRALAAMLAKTGRQVVQRQSLLEEIADLRFEVEQLSTLREENARLREQVGFQQQQPHKLILCEVVGRGEVSGWWRTVTLNRGSDDGIVVNRPVVTVEGLVGRVAAVSRRSCEVLLVTDPTFRVAGRLARTGAYGIVRGTGVAFDGDAPLDMLCVPQPFLMDYVAKDYDIHPHDRVETSGLGGGYPEGLLVGEVRETTMDAAGLYQRAIVVPAADLGTLKYVFVLEEQRS